MISVIIPALNESATISSVVKFAHAQAQVTEVLVVDDGSIDGTPEIARSAGARTITSTMLGKGASMHDGLLAAQNDLLVYLDGDLRSLHEDSFSRLVAPLLSGQADFVKASFKRNAGRVTTLTARPLLQTFFPELNHIEQPLGGMVAAQRRWLERLRFEDDYGVDVGLLLDATHLGARIAQANIGYIEHDSHPLEVLSEMATQVMRVILDRAARFGRLRSDQIREMKEVERAVHAGLPVILQKVANAEKLALLDMDGTLLDGRYIVELARRTYKTNALNRFIDHEQMSAESRTRFIATLFQGIPKETFTQTALEMPLMPGAVETVVNLRKRGYRVGIVTDSFFVAAEIVRRRVFADFSIAHVLRFRNEKATGEVTFSQSMAQHPLGCSRHIRCKLNVLGHLVNDERFNPQEVIYVGDGENDVCLLQALPLSFAFRPKSERVQTAARYVIHDHLTQILEFLPKNPPKTFQTWKEGASNRYHHDVVKAA
ncbi:MAG: HAD-IB family phosphatase [Blastocatellia bacterium]|nr:HAD-IB family phosphatase [Blastocatellia bacterium]